MHSSCYPGVMGQPSVPSPGGGIAASVVAVTVAADDISSSTESATSGLLTMEFPQPMQTAKDAKGPQHDLSYERRARKSADLMSRVDEQVRRLLWPLMQRALEVICTILHIQCVLALDADIFKGNGTAIQRPCSSGMRVSSKDNHQGIELYVLADISLREHVYAAAYCCIGVKMYGRENVWAFQTRC